MIAIIISLASLSSETVTLSVLRKNFSTITHYSPHAGMLRFPQFPEVLSELAYNHCNNEYHEYRNNGDCYDLVGSHSIKVVSMDMRALATISLEVTFEPCPSGSYYSDQCSPRSPAMYRVYVQSFLVVC